MLVLDPRTNAPARTPTALHEPISNDRGTFGYVMFLASARLRTSFVQLSRVDIQNNSELSEDLLVLRAASRDRPPSRRTRTRERASLPPWSASSASGTRARCHCLVPQGARDDGRGESVSVFDHWTRLCDHPENGFNTHRW